MAKPLKPTTFEELTPEQKRKEVEMCSEGQCRAYPMSEIARRFHTSITQVYRMVNDERLTVVDEDSSGAGRPAKLICYEEAYHAFGMLKENQENQRTQPEAFRERFEEAHANNRPLEGTGIGLREAQRKYGVSNQLIGQWVEKGEVLAFRYREDGKVEKVDDASLWDRLQTFKPKGRRLGQRRMLSNGRVPRGSRPSKLAARSQGEQAQQAGRPLPGGTSARRLYPFTLRPCPHCGGWL